MSRMQAETSLSNPEVFAGIDVGRRYLDVFLHPLRQRARFSNDRSGIGELVRLCRAAGVELIALEATGRYHRQLHRQLHDAGLAAAVVNPFRSRKFADALGQIAKTDRIDAEVLAAFAAMLRPEPSAPPAHEFLSLRDLVVARRQVLAEIGTLKRQLGDTENPIVRRQIRARLKMCERHRAALEAECQALIQSDAVLARRFAILTSIPGVGPITAVTLIAELDELGRANAREIAALAGLAPMNRDSGQRQAHRIIRGGRMSVRNALYMCAVVQTRGTTALTAFYRRLVSQGKNPKAALTAVMRKLVILANTLIAEDRVWQPERP